MLKFQLIRHKIKSMKIICIGRNYVEHAKELNNEIPSEPVVFFKPDTALIRGGEDFYLPDFSTDIHHELELVVKISKNGKNIDKKFAHRYYEEITLGIDFTARDIQQKMKEKGLPWERAKAFDGSAPIGSFVSKSKFTDVQNVQIELKINGQSRQNSSTSLMLYPIDVIIENVSKFVTLKTGDLIFTGTPSGVGSVKKGDVLEGFLNNEKLISFQIK